MYQKFLVPFVFFLLVSTAVSAQKIDRKKYINKAHKAYVEKLQLNEDQSKKMKDNLNDYNPKIQDLINKKSSHHQINRMIKTSIRDIYQILTPEQITLFNKIRLEIEPLKKYRLKP
jgi:septal ring factor EnvC (AmiA/AmiB activator)